MTEHKDDDNGGLGTSGEMNMAERTERGLEEANKEIAGLRDEVERLRKEVDEVRGGGGGGAGAEDESALDTDPEP